MAETRNFIAFEDGHTFLSQEELDQYREQKVRTAYAEDEYT